MYIASRCQVFKTLWSPLPFLKPALVGPVKVWVSHMLHFPLPINSPGCILMALEANPFHLQLGVLEQGGTECTDHRAGDRKTKNPNHNKPEQQQVVSVNNKKRRGKPTRNKKNRGGSGRKSKEKLQATLEKQHVKWGKEEQKAAEEKAT